MECRNVLWFYFSKNVEFQKKIKNIVLYKFVIQTVFRRGSEKLATLI